MLEGEIRPHPVIIRDGDVKMPIELYRAWRLASGAPQLTDQLQAPVDRATIPSIQTLLPQK